MHQSRELAFPNLPELECSILWRIASPIIGLNLYSTPKAKAPICQLTTCDTARCWWAWRSAVFRNVTKSALLQLEHSLAFSACPSEAMLLNFRVCMYVCASMCTVCECLGAWHVYVQHIISLFGQWIENAQTTRVVFSKRKGHGYDLSPYCSYYST